MSITLDTVNWGSAPNIGVTLAYDSQRSGQDMRYRIYASLAPVTGGSYFGYPVYISLYLDGDCAVSGGTVKAASPDRWSSAIEYDSGWITVSGKSGGTTALTVRLYSGSGSSRDQRYSYALDVEPGSSAEDFRLAAGDAAIGQTGTLTVTKPGSGYTFRFSYVFGGASGTLGGASLKTVSSTAAKAVYQWTVPAALAEQIPNALRGAGTMTMDIYDGGDYVGSGQRGGEGLGPVRAGAQPGAVHREGRRYRRRIGEDVPVQLCGADDDGYLRHHGAYRQRGVAEAVGNGDGQPGTVGDGDGQRREGVRLPPAGDL